MAGQNGQWNFNAGMSPYNAVQVQSKVGGSGIFSQVELFFKTLTGRDGFSTSAKATAGRQEIEICLCLDRSQSMILRSDSNAYPSGNPLLYPRSYYPSTAIQNDHSPPHPSLSRWAALRDAINVFLDEAGARTIATQNQFGYMEQCCSTVLLSQTLFHRRQLRHSPPKCLDLYLEQQPHRRR